MNWTTNLPFNWFDIFVLIMLMVGYERGKRRGMSQESLAVTKWVALVMICAIAYEPLGMWFSTATGVGKLTSFLIAYGFVALLVALIFLGLTRTLGTKLKGSDTFGKAEFYLGIPAGVVRFACIILALLALLNARFYSTAEVKAMAKFQNDNYGSNFFPTLSAIQDDVFRGSFVGSQVNNHLDFLLIKPTPAIGAGAAPSVRRREVTW
jgi:hypothetical protein